MRPSVRLAVAAVALACLGACSGKTVRNDRPVEGRGYATAESAPAERKAVPPAFETAGPATDGQEAPPLTETTPPAVTEVAPPPATAVPGALPPGESATADAPTASDDDAENDPLESFNRKVFWVNDKFDVWVLEPTARGWHFVLPDRVERCLWNFFTNVRFPVVLVNDLLQGKPKAAGIDVVRFGINSTIGIAGFFDPATTWGLDLNWEDFGQTLGVWGLPAGPFVMLPLLGPSNGRDILGLIGDYPASIVPFFVDQWILVGARATDIVNTRAAYLAEVEEAKRSSFDYYVFVRNAWAQRRKRLINDGLEAPSESQEELYFPDEE